MKDIIIFNRDNRRIAARFFDAGTDRLCIMSHGFLGTQAQPFFGVIAATLQENGISALTFDYTNSIGESDGLINDATMTGYCQDLQDIIAYARAHLGAHCMCLIGHSLGGMISILTAQHEKDIRCIITLSAPARPDSQRLRAFAGSDFAIETWRQHGSLSIFSPIDNKRYALNFSYYLDMQDLDTDKAIAATSHIMIIHGTKDGILPVTEAYSLYNMAKIPKEMHIIEGLTHNYYKERYLNQAIHHILDWTRRYLR